MPAPLVLVPGLLCDALLWSPQVAQLAGRADCRIPDHTRHEHVDEIARAILDEAPYGSFALAGLSMGGYVAQAIVRLAPERVQRLALLDTSALPDSEEASAGRRELIALARGQGLDAVVDRLLPRLLHPQASTHPRLVAVVRTMAHNTGVDAFERQQRAIMSRPDGRAALAGIACPTLVLCGRQDLLTPPELHRQLEQALSRASLVEVDDCGHLSTLERPEAVSQALAEWLNVPA